MKDTCKPCTSQIENTFSRWIKFACAASAIRTHEATIIALFLRIPNSASSPMALDSHRPEESQMEGCNPKSWCIWVHAVHRGCHMMRSSAYILCRGFKEFRLDSQ